MSDIDSKQKPWWWALWIFAAAGAVALHIGGGALAYGHLQGTDEDEYLGAQGDAIGIELTSATPEDTDLPVGPDADASVASPALPEQKAEVKETDLPKDTPDETEDPDRVVTTTENQKPKEDDPKVAAVQTQASEESVAQEATARQSIQGAKVDEHPTVVNQGIGKDAAKLIAKWRGQLSAYLNLHKRYPEVKSTKAVTVKVGFVIDRTGHVVSSRVIEGSGDSAYDQAALDMMTSVPAGARRSSRVGLSRIGSWVTTATRWAIWVRSRASCSPAQSGAQLAQPLVRKASSVTGEPVPNDSVTESPRSVLPLMGAAAVTSPPLTSAPAGPAPLTASDTAAPRAPGGVARSSSAASRRRMSAWLRSSATM